MHSKSNFENKILLRYFQTDPHIYFWDHTSFKQISNKADNWSMTKKFWRLLFSYFYIFPTANLFNQNFDEECHGSNNNPNDTDIERTLDICERDRLSFSIASAGRDVRFWPPFLLPELQQTAFLELHYPRAYKNGCVTTKSALCLFWVRKKKKKEHISNYAPMKKAQW